jgi:hypothetical protein
MKFPAEQYFETSLERMAQARLLHKQGTAYSLAIYVGGVAVECLLRAFKARHTAEFDERHDLLKLFSASRMLQVDRVLMRSHGWTDADTDAHLRSLQLALADIYQVWNNGYRFASERQLRLHLKKQPNHQTIKGDALKEVSRRFLTAAQYFVDLGITLWRQ